MRKSWHRFAIVGLLAMAISGVAMVGVGQATTTESKPATATAKSGDVSASGRHREWCDPNPAGRRQCTQARQALIREGVRVGPLNYNPPGCTAPGGCFPGYWFYVYS